MNKVEGVDAPREGRWIAKPLRARVPYVMLHAAFGMVWIVLVFGYILTHPDLKHMPIWLVQIQLAAVLAPIVYCLLREYRIRRLTRKDIALLERPGGLDEYSAEITVTVNSGSLGNDRGVVYFDEGLLGFVGGRTSFLLATEDLVFAAGKVVSDLDTIYRPLTLKATGGKATVTIRPLVGYGRGYRRSLRRFLRAKEITTGPRQLPPLNPYAPEAASTRPLPNAREPAGL